MRDYPETCLERWTRLKREKAELEEAMRQTRRRTLREEEDRLRLEEQHIRARRRRPIESRLHHADEPGQIEVGGFSPISLPMSYDPDPAPVSMPDPPAITPGGGSSGGGGASGDW